MEETLRLFKSVPIFNDKTKENSAEILKKTLPKGFIFSPEVLGNYADVDALIALVEKNYGLSGEQMNAAFHKSWKKVAEASDEQLVMEQMVHYLTTYGFQRLGVYSDASVYIPQEELDIPEIKNLKLTVIKGLTYPEIKEKLLSLLETGIALKEETITDITNIMRQLATEDIEIMGEEVERVKNKQVKIHLYDTFGVLPKDPVEFLRYVVYKATDETLLIKNKYLIEKLKVAPADMHSYFLSYKLEYGLEPLAGIFHRFKPLFLALKKSDFKIASMINKIRKLAVKHHKPMPEDYLNSVTAKIKKEIGIDKTFLTKELDRVNTFRKVRLAYALKFRMKNPRSIMYRIRNGRSYATEFDFTKFEFAQLKEVDKALNIVTDSIVQDLKKNVEGKKILIPSNMVYALPATEKQFTGNLPTGSYIETEGDLLVGIHWENLDHKTIDLDLSLINQDGKIGWDGGYRSDDRGVLFSGDITSAPKPKGASELFFVKKQNKVDFILNINYFNHGPEEVPYKIMVGEETPDNFGKNYMIDPNKVIAMIPSIISEKQTICAFVESVDTKNRIYFVQTALGKSITASNNAYTTNARQYLGDFYKNTINLNALLAKAGAVIVEQLEQDEECDIDLSPESLERDTIINLLK